MTLELSKAIIAQSFKSGVAVCSTDVVRQLQNTVAEVDVCATDSTLRLR